MLPGPVEALAALRAANPAADLTTITPEDVMAKREAAGATSVADESTAAAAAAAAGREARVEALCVASAVATC